MQNCIAPLSRQVYTAAGAHAWTSRLCKEDPASLRLRAQTGSGLFDLRLAADAAPTDGDAKARFWSRRDDF